ncbi:hypothetical protein V6669_20180 [Paenibacillus sp. Y5S-9]|uniref:hypothetical protein n=1 Tax=Paenibacillus sp. Y5S-9 TaxID=3122489 RepID=UPI0030D1201E
MPTYEVDDLIRATGTVTRRIKIVDTANAKDGTIDILVEERMKPIGLNWTVDISIDWKLAFRSNQRTTCTLVSKMQRGECKGVWGRWDGVKQFCSRPGFY